MRDRQAILAARFIFILLVLGLFYTQILRGSNYYRLSRKNSIRVVSLEACRGKILDRNGKAIADTRPSYDISVIPNEIRDKDKFFSGLSNLLGVSVEKIKKNYKKNFINPFVPVKICKDLDREDAITLEENNLQLKGTIIEIEPQRVYPFGKAASHVLGYLGQIDMSLMTKLKPYGYDMNDFVGYSGVEQYYDRVLRGKKGGKQVEVDNKGQRIRTLGYKPPKSGTDITVTIDIDAQNIADSYMQDRKGAVVIMDPYNGEIIALGSYPSYDPNDFIGERENIPGLLKDKRIPLFNRAISGQYAPGSVFKLITSIAALEKNHSYINNSYYCSGEMMVGNRAFRCWSTHGIQNFKDAFTHSCDVFFYSIGILVGPETMEKYAYIFGLGKETGIDLKYETKGLVPSPEWRNIYSFGKGWFKGDTANMSIGQGEILATPIQVAKLVSIFANGGIVIRPHLIKGVGSKKVVVESKRRIGVKKDNLNTINEYLYNVVDSSSGTANSAKVDGLRVAGKTGTAEVNGQASHGWFAGFVGKDRPEYAFCFFVENAGSSHVACDVAEKVFKDMLTKGLFDEKS